MIDENVKIHDQFSLEMKVGFVAKQKQKINNFAFNVWMFIPNSLDINRFTYTKDDFYKDLTSHIRLITPAYLLETLADPASSPFCLLEKSFHALVAEPNKNSQLDYENQIKMYLSILKSSLREEVAHVIGSKPDQDRDLLVDSYLMHAEKIVRQYRSLKQIIQVPSVPIELMDYFLFGDEFMSNLVEEYTFRMIEMLELLDPVTCKNKKKNLLSRIQEEKLYKESNGYLVVEKNNHAKNQELVFRLSMLKKYIESNLFLDVKKRKDGVWVEQLLFSVAAGLSMIFATFIAFSFQQKYGSFTVPVFVALVISYMLKDRIKELARYYFAHKLSRRYFDHKIDISTHNHEIGWVRESMDYISEQNVPWEVLEKRGRSPILEANNRAGSESIILYRVLMQLNRESIDANSEFPVAGVNEIFKLNISNFIRKMDNSEFPLYHTDEQDSIEIIPGEKIYYLNLILQARDEVKWGYKRYRVVFNRKGIHKIETFK